MLQQLRDKAKSFVSSVMLILLILSFGVWGIGDIFRQGGSNDWVVKVGDTKISASTVKRGFDNEVAQMRGLLGSEFTNQRAKEMGFLDKAIDKLVSLTTVNLETNRLGFNIPKTEILKTLESTPQLRNADGTFNKEMFARVLQGQGMNEAMFIEAQQQIAARNIIVRGLSAPVVIPSAMLNDMAAAYAQKRVAETVEINPGALNVVATSDEAVLKKYYDENKDSYKTPETRSISVLTLSVADAQKDIHVSDEDLKKAYEDRKSDFETPEKRDIVQVVLDDETKAKTLAEAALLSNIKSAAKTAGIETVSLDAITKKDLPPQLADAVYAAENGKLTGPVKSNLGWHVFVVGKIQPAKTRTFDDAKNDLSEQVQKDQSAEHMVQIANKIDDMLAANKPLEEIASAQGLTLATFENIDRAGTSNEKALEIPHKAEVLKAAFQYNEGESSPLLESKEGGYALVHINKVTATHVLDYDAVKKRVSEDWLKNAKDKKASELAETIAKELNSGKALSALSGEGIKKTSAPIMVDAKDQKEVPREALAPLFDMKKGEAVAVSTSEGRLVVRVKDIIAGSADEIETRKKSLAARLEQESITTNLDAYTAALRHAFPIVMDKAGLERLVGNNDGAM